MRNPRKIIIRPILTEKGMHHIAEANGYMFEVSRDANKIEIQQAVENLFGVNVRSVNTIHHKGKPKSLGRYQGRRPGIKKAIVFLEEGQTIKEFEVLE
ncbi:MAG: 50S ribosomal protein L23 [Candidatus Cloacimonadia bacterium]